MYIYICIYRDVSRQFFGHSDFYGIVTNARPKACAIPAGGSRGH